MINTLQTTITALSTFPDRPNYTSARAYATAVATWLRENKELSIALTTLIPELNTVIQQINSTTRNIEGIETNIEDIADVVHSLREEALAFKNLAKKWAKEDEDIEVENGEFSAKHWALKAYNAVATLPLGTLIDTLIGLDKTWSSTKIKGELDLKADKNNTYTKEDIDTNLQEKLESGTNIKTINNQNILEEGNLSIGEVPIGGSIVAAYDSDLAINPPNGFISHTANVNVPLSIYPKMKDKGVYSFAKVSEHTMENPALNIRHKNVYKGDYALASTYNSTTKVLLVSCIGKETIYSHNISLSDMLETAEVPKSKNMTIDESRIIIAYMVDANTSKVAIFDVVTGLFLDSFNVTGTTIPLINGGGIGKIAVDNSVYLFDNNTYTLLITVPFTGVLSTVAISPKYISVGTLNSSTGSRRWELTTYNIIDASVKHTHLSSSIFETSQYFHNLVSDSYLAVGYRGKITNSTTTSNTIVVDLEDLSLVSLSETNINNEYFVFSSEESILGYGSGAIGVIDCRKKTLFSTSPSSTAAPMFIGMPYIFFHGNTADTKTIDSVAVTVNPIYTTAQQITLTRIK